MSQDVHTTKVKKVGNYVYDYNSQPLGAGAFGTVYLGYEYKNNDHVVAVKVVDKDIFAEKKDFFLREVEILKEIKGKNVLQYRFAASSTSGNMYIVTDYCNGGNLASLLKANGGKLSLEKSLQILYQVAEAFVEIEQHQIQKACESGDKTPARIMHRDIKPENILLHDGNAVVSDFGFAKLVEGEIEKSLKHHTGVGTPYYMSPQQLKKQPYSHKCDVWSMGVATYEMIFGEMPWEAVSVFGLVMAIDNQELDFPQKIPDDLKDLLSKMLDKEDTSRIEWKDVLNHPALKKAKESEMKKEMCSLSLQ